MLDIVSQLVAAKAQVQENPGVSVTISLPLDDPRSQKLVEWAKKLMIPTTKIRPSGLVTQTGIATSATTEEFLEKLHRIVGDELYYELVNDFNGQMSLAKQQEGDDQVAELMTAGGFGSMVHAAGRSGLLGEAPTILREQTVQAANEMLDKSSDPVSELAKKVFKRG